MIASFWGSIAGAAGCLQSESEKKEEYDCGCGNRAANAASGLVGAGACWGGSTGVAIDCSGENAFLTRGSAEFANEPPPTPRTGGGTAAVVRGNRAYCFCGCEIRYFSCRPAAAFGAGHDGDSGWPGLPRAAAFGMECAIRELGYF